MKYYENEIYPVGLVLSYDAESVDRFVKETDNKEL